MATVFDSVIGTPVAIPYAAGWSLILVGTSACLAYEQLKAVHGNQPDHGSVVGRAILASAALATYTFICKAVWWAAQSIALAMYPDTEAQALGKLLGTIANRFKDYHFNILELGTGLRDGAVIIVGFLSWISAYLTHHQLQQVQVCVYNVIFAFGPLLIGLSCFALPTLRVWITALLEVSSWSITAAVVYRGISSQLQAYGQIAQNEPLLSTKFLDVISTMVFLSSLMIVVPVVTGRLLGSATLGELGRANYGNTAAQWLGDRIRGMQPEGPRAAASTSTPRPGDA